MTRICNAPKVVSAKLHDLDGMLSRQQAAAHDVSDLLQVLRVDMTTLHDKLGLMLSNSDFVPKLHMPCCAISGLQVLEAKEKLDMLVLPRVETSWHRNTFRLHHNSAGTSSTLHYKLELVDDGGGGVEPEISVVETHRDIAVLHAVFMAKLRSEMIHIMTSLGQTPAPGAARAALIVVDIQNDFVTGALKVGGGEEIIPLINTFRQTHAFDFVVLTQVCYPSARNPCGTRWRSLATCTRMHRSHRCCTRVSVVGDRTDLPSRGASLGLAPTRPLLVRSKPPREQRV
jgi:hypothetical protein